MPASTLRSLRATVASLVSGNVARGSMIAFVLRITSTGLGFAVSLLLARVLGASGFGEYAFALAWISLLAIPATLGTDRLLVREVAVLVHRERWAHLRGLLRASSLSVCAVATVLAGVAALLANTTFGLSGEMVATLSIGLLAVPVIATNRARQAVMRGLGSVGPSIIPEAIVHPLVLLGATAVVWLVAADSLDSARATTLYVLAMTAAWLVGAVFFRKLRPEPLRGSGHAYDLTSWSRGIGPFVLLSGLEVIHSNIDIIMLGFISGADATGVYRVANRMAALTAFPLAAINLALAPVIARKFAAENHRKIQQLATTAARMSGLLAALVTLGLFLFAPPVLGLLGETFEDGMSPMMILSAAHLLNAVLGCAALILMMTGRERDAALGVGAGAVLNALLNTLLIPAWGIHGAAIATAASLACVATALMVQVWRKLGIQSAAIRIGTK